MLLIYEQETRWYAWQEGAYQRLEPDEDGIVHSEILPGLWLEPNHFWEGDLAGVLTVLQRGLASPEHGTFVRHLRGEDQ